MSSSARTSSRPLAGSRSTGGGGGAAPPAGGGNAAVGGSGSVAGGGGQSNATSEAGRVSRPIVPATAPAVTRTAGMPFRPTSGRLARATTAAAATASPAPRTAAAAVPPGAAAGTSRPDPPSVGAARMTASTAVAPAGGRGSPARRSGRMAPTRLRMRANRPRGWSGSGSCRGIAPGSGAIRGSFGVTQAAGSQLPWNPIGIRTGRCTVATGPEARSSAGRTTSSAAPAASSCT